MRFSKGDQVYFISMGKRIWRGEVQSVHKGIEFGINYNKVMIHEVYPRSHLTTVKPGHIWSFIHDANLRLITPLEQLACIKINGD